jgi:hypothetical protein
MFLSIFIPIFLLQKHNKMRFNSLTIDDFYADPMQVREFALKQEFKVRGNYPGQRTVSFLNDPIKKKLRDILYPFAGEITNWGGEYTGSFQYTTAADRSWIHADSTTDWAAVCYLTPDAPVTAGTGIFRHKETGWMNFDYKRQNDSEYMKQSPPGDECQDYTKWEMVDRIGNVFNRLIMYRADNYHVSLDYFGKDINDGRLFQVFFFNTER